MNSNSQVIKNWWDRIYTPSPNAASLSKMIDYPVSLFTGLPTIEIPIYELINKDIKVPIKLSYHASGFKPNEHPSWVGLNWTLFSGGNITRKVNGFPDEDNFGGYVEDIVLDNPTLGLDRERDEFYFNILGYSGKFLINGDPYPGAIAYAESSPGIRITVIGLYQENVIKNICPPIYDEEYLMWCASLLEQDIHDYFRDPCQDYSQHISGFRIVLPNGWICDFGVKPEDPSSAIPIVDKSIDAPPYACSIYTYDTWHLIRIISPEYGTQITFNYTDLSEDYTVTSSKSYLWRDFRKDPNNGCHLGETLFINDSVSSNRASFNRYLQSIQTENATVYFHSSPSVQLKDYFSWQGSRCHLALSMSPNNNISRKLDFIEVKGDDMEPLLTYKFTYTSGLSRRLRLLSVAENGCNKYELEYDYPYLDPPYSSGDTDLWGFYINHPEYSYNYFVQQLKDIQQNDSSAVLEALKDEYINYVMSGTTSINMLKKIRYQTGGYTEFLYDKNYYNKYVKTNPETGAQVLMPENASAPGLRISSILHYDSDNSLLLAKNYEYDYGILAPKPTPYWEEEFYNGVSADRIRSFALHTALPLSSNSSPVPVTYSKVMEIDQNGKTEYFFRNYVDHYEIVDELYSPVEITENKHYHFDVPAINLYSTLILITPPYNTISHITNEIERGQLIFKRILNHAGDTLEKEKFFYGPNLVNYGENTLPVRKTYTYYKGKEWAGGFPEYYSIEGNFNKPFYPFNLIRKEKCVFPDGNEQNCIKTSENYSYDVFNLINREEINNEENNSIITKRTYTHNSPTYTNAYALEKPLIEKKFKRTSAGYTLIKADYYQYDCLQDSTLLIRNISSKNIGFNETFDSTLTLIDTLTYDMVLNVNNFDELNNPIEVAQRDGNISSFIWGYKGNKLISNVLNAGHREIFHSNFETQSNFTSNIPSSYSFDSGLKRTGDKSLKITGSGEAYVFMPFLDIDNNENKKYKYSAWVYSDSPSYDLYFFRKTQNDGETSGYSTPAHYVTSNITNKWVYIEGEVEVTPDIKCLYLRVDNNGGGNVWFDDLRLHPSDAQMTTYTHNPLIGITSQTDPNGQTTYYEYDDLGRLTRIRDHENNILQEYKYNYTTQ